MTENRLTNNNGSFPFYVGFVFLLSVVFIFLVFCVVFCFCVCMSSSCVLCTQCFWIVRSWLPLRFSLSFSNLHTRVMYALSSSGRVVYWFHLAQLANVLSVPTGEVYSAVNKYMPYSYKKGHLVNGGGIYFCKGLRMLTPLSTTNRNYSAILATLQITSYVHSRNSS